MSRRMREFLAQRLAGYRDPTAHERIHSAEERSPRPARMRSPVPVDRRRRRAKARYYSPSVSALRIVRSNAGW